MRLEHAAAYLPYGLKWCVATEQSYYCPYPLLKPYGTTFDFSFDKPIEVYVRNVGRTWIEELLLCEKYKPILRPLSDLTKEITENGENNKFFFFGRGGEHDYYVKNPVPASSIIDFPYSRVQILLKYHFDIFGLIESGEAIDVNTLEKNPYE